MNGLPIQIRAAVAADAPAVAGMAGELAQSFTFSRPQFEVSANGPVGWVEEILISRDHRGYGTGRALMIAFEQWAAAHGCAMVALATRRAAQFYRAIGYEESAVYHRKILPRQVTPELGGS